MEETKNIDENKTLLEEGKASEHANSSIGTKEDDGENHKSEEDTEESIIKLIKEEAVDENHIVTLLRGSSAANITSFKERVSGNVNSGNGTMNIYYSVPGSIESEVYQLNISKEEVCYIKGVYEKIPEYYEAKGIIREQNILILYNESHCGKRTTAIKLLSEFGYENLIEIALIGDIKNLNEFNFNSSTGYLIDGIAFENLTKLNEAYLNKLSSALREKRSCLIITYNNNIEEKNIIRKFTTGCSRPRDVVKAIENHLYYRYKNDSKLDKMLNILKDEEFVNTLNSSFNLKELDTLIDGLEGIIEGFLDKNMVLDSLSLSISIQIKEWFRLHKQIEDWCFFIALAAFEGRKYEEVMEAAVALSRHICDTQPGMAIQTKFALFKSRDQWIELLNAKLKTVDKNTEMGKVAITLVEFDKPGFAETILKYVWMNYDYLKKPLIQWLIEYSSYEKIDMTVKIAEAVSHLVKVDLVGIKENYIMPCAKSESTLSRLSSAMVLDSMIQQKELAGYALSLLHNWSYLKNKELLWTTAAAYGLSAGVMYSDRAFKDFSNIIKYKDLDIFEILSISLGNLFDWGKECSEFYSKVMDSLQQWSEKDDKWIVRNSLFIFLELSMKKTVKSKGKKFSKVLVRAVEDDKFNEVVISLWKSAFNEARTRELAEYVLRYWVSLGDLDEKFYAYVEYFIKSLFQAMTDFEKRRIKHCIEKWTNSQKELLVSARVILPQLVGR